MKIGKMFIWSVIGSCSLQAMQHKEQLYYHLLDDLHKQANSAVQLEIQVPGKDPVPLVSEAKERVPLVDKKLAKKVIVKKQKTELELLQQQAHERRQKEQQIAEGEANMAGAFGCIGGALVALIAAVLCL